MVNRAFKAIRRADVVLLMVDVEAGITDQVGKKMVCPAWYVLVLFLVFSIILFRFCLIPVRLFLSELFFSPLLCLFFWFAIFRFTFFSPPSVFAFVSVFFCFFSSDLLFVFCSFFVFPGDCIFFISAGSRVGRSRPVRRAGLRGGVQQVGPGGEEE